MTPIMAGIAGFLLGLLFWLWALTCALKRVERAGKRETVCLGPVAFEAEPRAWVADRWAAENEVVGPTSCGACNGSPTGYCDRHEGPVGRTLRPPIALEQLVKEDSAQWRDGVNRQRARLGLEPLEERLQ